MGLFSRKSRNGGGDRTRFFFATDLHSSEACFRKLLATPRVYELDTVIMGGDCTGKMLIPLIEDEDTGSFTCEWAGETVIANGAEELAEQEKRIRYAGLYPIRVTRAEADELRRNPEQLTERFSARMIEVVGEWTALAEERLAEQGIHMIMTPGNDDEFEVDEVLDRSEYVDSAEDKITRIGPHEMLSVGWSNKTPWDTPRECSEEELAEKIDRLAAQIEDMDTAIFNIHVPPYGTGLDDAPKLDENLKPVQGGTVMTAVGSTAVLESIQKHQPLLSLHGHIHESRGVQKIGRTTSINPGSVYGEGILQGVIVNLDADGIQYSLTDG